jgi:hypothetical protein
MDLHLEVESQTLKTLKAMEDKLRGNLFEDI